jgi:hypothetical protein
VVLIPVREGGKGAERDAIGTLVRIKGENQGLVGEVKDRGGTWGRFRV